MSFDRRFFGNGNESGVFGKWRPIILVWMPKDKKKKKNEGM